MCILVELYHIVSVPLKWIKSTCNQQQVNTKYNMNTMDISISTETYWYIPSVIILILVKQLVVQSTSTQQKGNSNYTETI